MSKAFACLNNYYKKMLTKRYQQTMGGRKYFQFLTNVVKS